MLLLGLLSHSGVQLSFTSLKIDNRLAFSYRLVVSPKLCITRPDNEADNKLKTTQKKSNTADRQSGDSIETNLLLKSLCLHKTIDGTIGRRYQ
jgi:hypothetical protein